MKNLTIKTKVCIPHLSAFLFVYFFGIFLVYFTFIFHRYTNKFSDFISISFYSKKKIFLLSIVLKKKTFEIFYCLLCWFLCVLFKLLQCNGFPRFFRTFERQESNVIALLGDIVNKKKVFEKSKRPLRPKKKDTNWEIIIFILFS